MIIYLPPTYRKRAGRLEPKQTNPTPPVEPLMLVSAAYEDSTWVRLTFDRAVDIDALDAAQITVDDDLVAGVKFVGSNPATLLGPTVVQVELSPIGASSGGAITLDASDENGIVASDDGAAWAGVENWVITL